MANNDDTNKKLDLLDTRLDNLNITLVQNTASLEEHMRRTSMLEAIGNERLEASNKLFAHLTAEIAPLKRLAEKAKGASWAISVALAALLAAKSLDLF